MVLLNFRARISFKRIKVAQNLAAEENFLILCIMKKKQNPNAMAGLTDQEIIDGLRNRDEQITRNYFYGICEMAYRSCNHRYALAGKQGLDRYTLFHEYYLLLAKNDFHNLEDRKPGKKLVTWMINGFRFLVLDRLKGYNKENGRQSFMEHLNSTNLRFDLPDNNLSEDVRNTISEICYNELGRDSRASLILQMMLIDGFKGKEVAAQLGISPSAVTQQYHKLMENVVIPYFKRNYVASPMAMPVAETCYDESPAMYSQFIMTNNIVYTALVGPDWVRGHLTPDHVTSLRENEIFVFGSNLMGMHGGGAARTARLHFGAVLGNGDGPQGRSYAIPTMQGGVETIRPYVDKFINYAKAHPDQVFLVTAIGCGIAGFIPEEIAPLFREAVRVDNIHLPQSFWDVLSQS